MTENIIRLIWLIIIATKAHITLFIEKYSDWIPLSDHYPYSQVHFSVKDYQGILYVLLNDPIVHRVSYHEITYCFILTILFFCKNSYIIDYLLQIWKDHNASTSAHTSWLSYPHIPRTIDRCLRMFHYKLLHKVLTQLIHWLPLCNILLILEVKRRELR